METVYIVIRIGEQYTGVVGVYYERNDALTCCRNCIKNTNEAVKKGLLEKAPKFEIRTSKIW